MEKVFLNGKMGKYTKVILLMGLNMEKEFINFLKVVNMKESIIMVLERERQNIHGQMEEYLKDILKMGNQKEKDKLFIMEKLSNVNIKKENLLPILVNILIIIEFIQGYSHINFFHFVNIFMD